MQIFGQIGCMVLTKFRSSKTSLTLMRQFDTVFVRVYYPEKHIILFVTRFFSHQRQTVLLLFEELSLCHDIKYSNAYIFATWWCKPLIFQTQIIWSKRIHSLNSNLKYSKLDSKDMEIRILEFVANTQFLYDRVYLQITQPFLTRIGC